MGSLLEIGEEMEEWHSQDGWNPGGQKHHTEAGAIRKGQEQVKGLLNEQFSAPLLNMVQTCCHLFKNCSFKAFSLSFKVNLLTFTSP